ncbi:MAG: nucleotide exchange factor GrpE [Opitutaceae bacterium]|nr:nucleotide exchange factor GrpE [Opitutaceae bacterium]
MSDTTEPKPDTQTPTSSDAEKAAPAPAAGASPAEAPAAAVDAAAAAAQVAAQIQAQIDQLRKERDDNYNHFVRAMADLENYRRRVVREKEELRQFGQRDLVEAIIPVFEGLALAIKSATTAPDPQVIAQGVTLVLEQFRGVLASKGLTEINPAPGADFDPNQHESIAHGPSDTIPEEKILQVVRTGFSLNGRIIRPASVVLSGGPAKV